MSSRGVSFAVLMCVGVAHGLSMTKYTAPAADAPDLADVTKDLGAVNDTIDKVSDVLDMVNSTAYDMLDTFLSSTAAFAAVLDTLQKGADAAGKLPISGASDIAATATKFISLANKSLMKAQGDLPAAVSSVSSQLDAILPQLQDLANSIIDQFMDAAAQVQALSNLTDSGSLLRKTTPATKKHKGKKHKGKKDAVMSLLQEHAMQAVASESSVDRSVAQKGGGGSACQKAMAKISKANATLIKLDSKIEEVNGTGAGLLVEVLSTATGALDALNSTAASALSAADAIPSNLLDPVTSALDKVLSTADELADKVNDQVSTVQDAIVDAQTTLSTVFALSTQLADAVTEAECAGACGKAPADCTSS